ncbi:hypothetical protein CL3_34730 [butyrate-producing bacterium SM4/1]|nr:hypothetical protein CL3_34730 [butyrate-producing bacterium SM4/1]
MPQAVSEMLIACGIYQDDRNFGWREPSGKAEPSGDLYIKSVKKVKEKREACRTR